MKKNIFVILLLMVLAIVPIKTKAIEYTSLNFKDTLADEGIELSNSDYKENDNQVTVYLFRGKGCSHCYEFLTFMNSISKEYGKYFKMVSYEVWYDTNNADLMDEVSRFMGDRATGVPYVIIGKKVFPGFASSYEEKIKTAIKELYETKKSERYDVFEAMKNPNDGTNSGSSVDTLSIIIWNFIFIFFATITIITFCNSKINGIKNILLKNDNNEIELKEEVEETKEEKDEEEKENEDDEDDEEEK